MADLSFVLECLHQLGLPRLSRTVLALLVLARRLEPLPSPAGRRRLLHKTAFTDDVVTCDQQNNVAPNVAEEEGALRVTISCASASSPGARAAASSHSSAAFDAAIAACAAVACANRRRSDDT